MDYQMEGWSYRRPIVPLYYIEDCWMFEQPGQNQPKSQIFKNSSPHDLYRQWLWLQEAISSIQICRCLILTLQIHPLPKIHFFSLSNSNAPNYVWYSTPHMGSNIIRIGSVLSLYLQFWKKKCVLSVKFMWVGQL